MTIRSTLIVEGAGVLAGVFLLAAAIVPGSLRPDPPVTIWLAVGGCLLVAVCAAGAALTLYRHFTALERLRGGIVMLLADNADTLAPADTEDVERIRGAIDALLAQRLERQALPDHRLAAVLGSIPEAIVATTAAGQVSLVNDAARALLGAERVAVGTSLYAALGRHAVETAIAASRMAGRPVEAELHTVESEPLDAKVCDLGEHGGAVITFPAVAPARQTDIQHDLALHDAPPPPDIITMDSPLADLPVLVFDCETTGLDVRQDAIVALGGVRMQGGRIYRGKTIDRLVDPDRPIPRRSTKIHGITGAMVAGAGRFENHWPALERLMQGTVLVGHNIAFDIAQLRTAAKRAGIEWSPPPSLDTLLLVAALEPAADGYALESVAERFGVSVHGRHTALGDSLVTAEIYARLLPRLAERGVATLGEAIAFGQQATAFVERQRGAGWQDDTVD